MKIAFICASLERGRDGVGDYTRRLAAACIELGHECRLFSIHDRHVQQFTAEADREESYTVSRWSPQQPWTERIVAIRAAIGSFAPDRISWQFVSYGFNPKGVVGPDLIDLAVSLRTFRSHVMLHELWIGIARGDSAWMRFVGWRQRRGILAFLQAVSPAAIETSNFSYAAALQRYGWRASVLPLFSNIPVVPATAEERAAALARHLPSEFLTSTPLVVATFGTLHPQWQPEAAARWLRDAAARLGRKPILLALGRIGAHGPGILKQWSDVGVQTKATGELNPVEVSQLLQGADLGIAAHPWALAGKSGVVAAMLAHGLPTLLPRDDWHLREGTAEEAPFDPRLARLADVNAADAGRWLERRQAPVDSLSSTVSLFLTHLAA